MTPPLPRPTRTSSRRRCARRETPSGAPVTELIQDGLSDGRRRRTRRRVSVLGGSAALVAIAVGGAILPSAVTPAKHAQAGPASGHSTTPRSRRRPRDRTRSPPRTWSRRSRACSRRAPSRRHWPAAPWKAGSSRSPWASSTTATARRWSPSASTATALRAAGGLPGPEVRPRRGLRRPEAVRRLPAGGPPGVEYPDHHGAKDWSADLYRTDGGHISFNEWNSPQEKDAPTTRTDPPLSPAQLKAAVTGHAFDAALASIPASITGKGSRLPRRAPRPSLRGQVAVAAGYFGYRQGWPGRDRRAAPERGKGADLLLVSVERWDLGTLTARKMYASTFPGATTLADGTRLYVQEIRGKGGTGTKVWQVAVSRKDGTRVVLLLANSADLAGRPTRATPVLSTEQLTTLALSAGWESVK
ncbi:hypothetical protein ACFQZC_17000 [Streptacidiphilus monticola]